MMLSDSEIRDRSLHYNMIAPFAERTEGNGIISYGLSSYGYDIRLGNRYRLFESNHNVIVDPKNFNDLVSREIVGEECLIPPNSFVLAESYETFSIPRDILVLCLGKSTMARCGLIVNVTPLEPEWEGVLTIEISNTTPLPAKIYSDEGIAQLVFLKADRVCDISYSDRKGKYQNQTGLTLPKVT